MGELVGLRPTSSLLKTCRCGSQWWDTAVNIDTASGRVVGHVATVTCHECGAPATV